METSGRASGAGSVSSSLPAAHTLATSAASPPRPRAVTMPQKQPGPGDGRDRMTGSPGACSLEPGGPGGRTPPTVWPSRREAPRPIRRTNTLWEKPARHGGLQAWPHVRRPRPPPPRASAVRQVGARMQLTSARCHPLGRPSHPCGGRHCPCVTDRDSEAHQGGRDPGHMDPKSGNPVALPVLSPQVAERQGRRHFSASRGDLGQGLGGSETGQRRDGRSALGQTGPLLPPP